jgi:2'-5' RNA ligase
MARIFVGVELDAGVKAAAAAAADALRAELASTDIRVLARWVPQDNLHITLFFIGDVPGNRVNEVRAALAPPFARAAFDVHLSGLGAFPPSGVPRVFWIGVRDGSEALGALHAEVSARLAAVGCEPEGRPYSAHLTIARVKDLQSRGHASRVRRILAGRDADAGPSRVSAVTLFESRVSPKGSTYEPLLRLPLF